MNDIYLNIIFYFELFDLPICVLYIQNDMGKFEKLSNILKENKKRKFVPVKEKKGKILNFFTGKLNKTSTDVVSDLTTLDSKYSSNLSNNNISDVSINSVKSGNDFSSNTEMDIWTNYIFQKQNKKQEKKGITNENKNNDNKNEVISKLKETKSFMSDIINYFNTNSQEKLKIFLDNYDKLESMRQHDYVNIYLKMENEKYKKKGGNQQVINIKESPIKKVPENPNNIKNSNNQNSNILPNQIKNDDKFSINTRYNFNLKEKTEIINNNKDNDNQVNSNNINQNKIFLDNTNNNINTIIMNQVSKNSINKNKQDYNQNINILDKKINIDCNENINNKNKSIGIHSPKIILSNKSIYPNNMYQINSSKINKIKSLNINDINMKNNLNKNINKEQNLNINNNNNNVNNEMQINDERNNYNNIKQNNQVYLNQKNNNNNIFNPQNYFNKTTITKNKNDLFDKRYGNTNKNKYIDNIEKSNIPIDKTQNIKNISVNNQQNFPQEFNDIQNQYKMQKPISQRFNNYQKDLTNQKYQVHKVPAYKSIFDQDNNL